MAGRPMGRLHQEDVRAKIQTSQLVNRLTDHVFGRVELSASQVTAAMGLIKKVLPDLAAVQHTGADGGPIQTESVNVSNAPDDVIRWIAQQRTADPATHH